MTGSAQALWSLARGAVNAICLGLMAVPGLLCWIEHRLAPRSEYVFAFWSNLVALVPGSPGIWLRQAFYTLTLDACRGNFHIGFGSVFTHRHAEVEPGAYVGAYALIGRVALRHGCLIGSRASLLSGGALHELDTHGRWLPSDSARAIQIEVGAYAWIGEGAIIAASVGPGAMVAVGSVVATPVPAHVQVAGNPARFVRRLVPAAKTPEDRHARHPARVLPLH